MTGQEAYVAEVAVWPFDHRGQPRTTWDQLTDFARASWNKYPSPRERPPYARKTVDGSPLPSRVRPPRTPEDGQAVTTPEQGRPIATRKDPA